MGNKQTIINRCKFFGQCNTLSPNILKKFLDISFQHNKQKNPVKGNKEGVVSSILLYYFQNLAVDLDTEGRYLFLNAIANQLRYPNSHTHYFSCTLLYLFAEANAESIQEQITRYVVFLYDHCQV